ncbi:hypothetical protein BMETH_225_0 [methanotrophic bacterial endosymbiont of Bathymodiolus sp.]|nr:hypothetical protein BMETH_225_0 [methanotrophic bacterial endosymbiont of Bathymodiolus sp.]
MMLFLIPFQLYYLNPLTALQLQPGSCLHPVIISYAEFIYLTRLLVVLHAYRVFFCSVHTCLVRS